MFRKSAGCAVDINLGIFAINLDRSPERWDRVVSQFAGLPWPLRRVAAIDGRERHDTLTYRGLSAIRPDGVGWSVTRHRLVSYAEEACFCSHLKALREFLDSDHTYAMIIEDDARIIGDLAPVMETVGKVCRDDTVLKVSGSPRQGSRLALRGERSGPFTIVHSFEPASNATAYIVAKHTAAKLVHGAGHVLAPFDDYLSAPALHGCAVAHVSPWAVTNRWPKNDVPSTLAESRLSMPRKRGLASWLSQGAFRARLRLSLWRSVLRSGGRPVFARWSP